MSLRLTASQPHRANRVNVTRYTSVAALSLTEFAHVPRDVCDAERETGGVFRYTKGLGPFVKLELEFATLFRLLLLLSPFFLLLRLYEYVTSVL
jgi:hypothetical protein